MDDREEGPQQKKRKLKATKIDHTYRDFSQVEIITEITEEGEKAASETKVLNFPAKLHEILSKPEYRNIIGWLPHGRSWTIFDKELLASEICPKYFSHDKFESFNR